MRVMTLLVVAMTAAPMAAHAADVKWELDTSHSHVAFSVRHLGLSNVRGEFKKFEANVLADDKTAKITSGEATVQAASVDTGISGRDDHLRGDAFFDVAKYPTMKLVFKSIQWNGNKFIAKADMTMLATTKSVEVRGELVGTRKVNFGAGDQLRAGYSASTTINRQEFGLRFNQMAEGVSMVGDEVKIEFEIELFRKL